MVSFSSEFLLLTTFRKSGQPVGTPIWFVQLDDGLYCKTGQATGKVKRIGHTPRVTLGPCDRRGRPEGPAVPATASLLPASRGPEIEAALNRRYGLFKKVIDLVLWVRGVRPAYLRMELE